MRSKDGFGWGTVTRILLQVRNRDFPFAASKTAIVPDFGPISRPNGYFDKQSIILEGYHRLAIACGHDQLQECAA